jgi:hypothetical protein
MKKILLLSYYVSASIDVQEAGPFLYLPPPKTKKRTLETKKYKAPLILRE